MTWLRNPSLLSKLLLSTSIFITLLLGLTGWFVLDQVLRSMSEGLQSEMQDSFRAYEGLWHARADMLRSVSLVLSTMSDVRASFGTNDQATIRDTASEIWSRISDSHALFLVTDPQGNVIASLGGSELPTELPAVREAARNFPKQTEGFVLQNGRLYQMVVTPVYVDAADGQGLLKVLAAGYRVDNSVAADLKIRTGGGDFVFLAAGRTVASTMDAALAGRLALLRSGTSAYEQVEVGNDDYAVIGSTLSDMLGHPLGEILIVRSFGAVQHRIGILAQRLFFTWVAAILVGLFGSSLLARRVLNPVKHLDQAAARIACQEYDTRVPETSKDELGRLAVTFNAMCRSIQEARAELIRQERISTIGRLSSSIVHDLRNPLAAIYGGAEMLMDDDLSSEQVKRLAGNIYRSSRAVKDLLQELVDISRQRMKPAEVCRLREVIGAAVATEANAAGAQGVQIDLSVGEDIELSMERARMERVFVNLIGNAIEAMQGGGNVSIAAERRNGSVLVRVEDDGPGIPEEIRARLFQPFVTAGKKNGLGLGLAMARQTVLDHGGDLSIDQELRKGTRFWVKLPG